MAAYIKFDGVDGECADTFEFNKDSGQMSDDGHKKWIDILSVDKSSTKGDVVPVEDFSLNYEEIKVTYQTGGQEGEPVMTDDFGTLSYGNPDENDWTF